MALAVVTTPPTCSLSSLGIGGGALGYGLKTFSYWLEDAVDELWAGRPEWARPAVGGVALGAPPSATSQISGVGYPVMDRALAGHMVFGLLIVLMLGKIVAASVTLSIGGSGGVFAPSLFMGAMGGSAFGAAMNHLFGSGVGPPRYTASLPWVGYLPEPPRHRSLRSRASPR